MTQNPSKEKALPSTTSIKDEDKSLNSSPRWIDNSGKEVEQVFGFNYNSELINGRAAMVGFLMLILTEFIFKGAPVTQTIFGIGWYINDELIAVYLYKKIR